MLLVLLLLITYVVDAEVVAAVVAAALEVVAAVVAAGVAAVVAVVDLVAVLFLDERYQVPTQTNTQKSSPTSQCKSRTAVLIMCLLQGGECPPGIRVFPKRYLLRQNAAIISPCTVCNTGAAGLCPS